MSAGRLNLYIEAGATFELLLTWKDPDGVPINVTGYQARMQVRPTAVSDEVLLDLTSSPAAGITLGGVAGTIAIRVGADDTDVLEPGGAAYDLEMVLIADPTQVVRLIQGGVTISGQVSR